MIGEHVFDEPRGRNVLTLEERVQAIREYDKIPIYQKVADIMNCSSKQIKNIVDNRESILLYYASMTGNFEGGLFKYQEYQDRGYKVTLLNRVIYEWILRIQSRTDVGKISFKLIRAIALDVKSHIKISNFYPNTEWLDCFLKEHNLTPEDLLHNRVYAKQNEPKQHLSLKISDIVDYIKQQDPEGTLYKPCVKDKKGRDNDIDNYSKEDHDVSDDEGDCEAKNEIITSTSTDPTDDQIYDKSRKRKLAKGVYIANYEQALKHLKPLEDFVLLKENFRAIGVVSQLEMMLKKTGDPN